MSNKNMNKNKIIIAVVAVVLIGALAAMFFGGSPKTGSVQVQQNMEKNPSAVVTSGDGNIQAEITVGEAKTFTMAYVSGNNSASSCYTVVNGGVYDVTGFINKHPGGAEKILNLCGKDGSVFFNKQHGGQAKAEAALASLKIGTLAQ